MTADFIGTARIPRQQFLSLLGDNAFLVWQMLIVCRRRWATITVGIDRLTDFPGFQRLSYKQVQRALARLRGARLVRNLCYVCRKHHDGSWREVCVREVYGALQREYVVVPCDIHPAVLKLNPQGGRHGGARVAGPGKRIGRPPKPSGVWPVSAVLAPLNMVEKPSGVWPISNTLEEETKRGMVSAEAPADETKRGVVGETKRGTNLGSDPDSLVLSSFASQKRSPAAPGPLFGFSETQ